MRSIEMAQLYGKLRAALLARHFATNQRFRSNFFYQSNTLWTGMKVEDLLALDPQVLLYERWNVHYHGGDNPLMESSRLLTCMAVEHHLGFPGALGIIRAALETLGSLYKFRGNHFDGYILRWDPVLTDRWFDDGQSRYCQTYYINDDGSYNYCTPLNDPRSIRRRPLAEWNAMTRDEKLRYHNSRWNWLDTYRRWEASMDELVGLVTAYDIVHRLVDVPDIRAEVRRQVANLGDYLAEHSYYLVRPGGGFNARGPAGILPALEHPFGRVFQRITGDAYRARNDFRAVMEKADVWKSLEEPFNWFTVAGAALGALIPLVDPVLMPLGLAGLLSGSGRPLTAAQVGQIWAIYLHRDVFDTWDDHDVNPEIPEFKYKDGYSEEFALAYLLSFLGPAARFQAYAVGSRNASPYAWGAGFLSWIGLTGLDDNDSLVRDQYLGWLPERLRNPDLQYWDIAFTCFSSGVAVVLGAGEAEEKRLVVLLGKMYDEYVPHGEGTGRWKSDLDLVWADDAQAAKEDFKGLDFMVGLALAWLHAKRRRDRGEPVTTPGFPEIPVGPSWPRAAVPAPILEAAQRGEIALPLGAVQRGSPLQVGPEGADLFLDDPVVPRPPVPDPVLPPRTSQPLIHDLWFTVDEGDTDVATSLVLRFGDEYQFEAEGSIWAGVVLTGESGPNGWEDKIEYDHKFPLVGKPDGHPYCLLGRFGEDGAYFFIGDGRKYGRRRFLLDEAHIESRPLFLRINDDAPGNGHGSFRCRVRVWGTPPPPPPRLVVTVWPATILLDTPQRVTVFANDAATGAPVAGKVRIRLAVDPPPPDAEFVLNTPFDHTFSKGKFREFDTNSKKWTTTLVEPTGLADADAPQYPKAAVPFDFRKAPPKSRPDAAFLWQSVPATMTAGQGYDVTITMRNTGTTTWTPEAGFKLGAQNPQDNLTWGISRAAIPAAFSPGSEATFQFRVTAPTAPGMHNFQWRMVQEFVEWFGQFTPNVAVTVPEPAECGQIRAQISEHYRYIQLLNSSQEGLDPKNRGDRAKILVIQQQIAGHEEQIAALNQRAARIGCG
jgi:hypothetical protein